MKNYCCKTCRQIYLKSKPLSHSINPDLTFSEAMKEESSGTTVEHKAEPLWKSTLRALYF